MKRDRTYRACLSHREEVYAFARRLTADAAEADDLLQEVYARAFAAWRGLRDPARARAWLFAIARRTFLNRRRHAAVEARFAVLEGGDLAPRSALPAAVSTSEVLEALRSLPEEMATVLALCDVWGFRYDEIAEIVECPVGTVRSRLFRARAALAELLESTATLDRGRGGRP